MKSTCLDSDEPDLITDRSEAKDELFGMMRSEDKLSIKNTELVHQKWQLLVIFYLFVCLLVK